MEAFRKLFRRIRLPIRWFKVVARYFFLLAIVYFFVVVPVGFFRGFYFASVEPFDESKRVYLGDAARQRIDAPIPKCATDVYLWDGGNWNGTITYWACTCDTIEQCWSVVVARSWLESSDFQRWRPSRYAVVMAGPGFYGDELATPLWDVASIRNGVFFEHVQGDCRQMIYYAIDFEHRRVFCHRESGGFPPDHAK